MKQETRDRTLHHSSSGGFVSESSQKKSISSQLRHASVEKRPNAQCFLYGKKCPFTNQKPKLRPRLMVHPFFVNMLDKFEALMRKVAWHLFLRILLPCCFSWGGKNNGGHIFKSHKEPCYNHLSVIHVTLR